MFLSILKLLHTLLQTMIVVIFGLSVRAAFGVETYERRRHAFEQKQNKGVQR